MQAPSFVDYAKQTYGVDLELQQAKEIRSAFFAANMELPPYYKLIEHNLVTNGVIYSIMGRRYYTDFECISDRRGRGDYVRRAINFTVQSAASDYVLCGLIEVDKCAPKDEVRLVGTVHDSVLLLVKKNANMRKNLENIKAMMEQPRLVAQYLNPDYPIDIPIVVDVEIGPWGMGVEIEDYFREGE